MSLTETLALVGSPIHKHLGGDDIAEGEEHLGQLRVSKLLGEVVDKQVTAFGTCRWGRERHKAPKEGGGPPLGWGPVLVSGCGYSGVLLKTHRGKGWERGWALRALISPPNHQFTTEQTQ